MEKAGVAVGLEGGGGWVAACETRKTANVVEVKLKEERARLSGREVGPAGYGGPPSMPTLRAWRHRL